MRIFVFVFILVLLTVGVFIGVYLTQSFAFLARYKITFWTIHALLVSTIIIAPFIYRTYPIDHPDFFYDGFQFLSYAMMGFYFVLFGFALLNQVGFGTIINFTIADPARRQFLKSSFAFIALGLSGIIASVGYLAAIKTPEVVKVSIPFANLPAGLQGLKIVQLSDVHVDQTIKGDFVKRIVDISNSLNPDLVVLTGDFVDGTYFQLKKDVDYFKNLNAPLGIFYVPGNHEYYWGVDEWVKIFTKLGAKVLLNEHVIVKKNNDELVIAGVHDYSASRVKPKYVSSPQKAIQGAPVHLKKILLAHQSRSAFEAEEAGFDFQISGHTHAGQFFPSNILVYFFEPFVKGLYRYKKMWIYVNRGTGYWGPPNRMGVPSEITLIELTNSTNLHTN